MNLLLAFIWVALTGEVSYPNLTFGFVIGFGILWLAHHDDEDKRYFTRVPKIILLLISYFYEMLRTNIEVAYEVTTPKYFFSPAIVRYPTNCKTDLEINLLSSMILLTPGTIVLDVSEDKKFLYIHVLYFKDKESFINETRKKLENPLLEVMR